MLRSKYQKDGRHVVSIALGRVKILLRRLASKWLLGWDVATMGAGAYVRGARHIEMGRNFRCRSNLWIEAVTRYGEHDHAPRIVIGDNFSCGDGVHIAAINAVAIGNDVLVGSNVLITDHSHGCYDGQDQSDPEVAPGDRMLVSKGPVTIGNKVFIGDNVCVLAGTDVGRGAIVAANSVVTRDVPVNTIVAGNPAKPIKRFCETSRRWVKI